MPARRRPRANAGRTSYEAYVSALRKKTAVPVGDRKKRHASLVINSCIGLQRLAEKLGHALCRISILGDSIAIENEAHAAFVIDDRRQSLKTEQGFLDWQQLALTYDMARGIALPTGVDIARNRLNVTLLATVSGASFERKFRVLMNPYRIDEALMRGDAVSARRVSGRLLSIQPRYSRRLIGNVVHLERVNDLYAFDPWQDLHRLACIASAAACDEADPHTAPETIR